MKANALLKKQQGQFDQESSQDELEKDSEEEFKKFYLMEGAQNAEKKADNLKNF